MATTTQKFIAEVAADIKAKGYRVFISGSGTYGIFTDDVGAKVISFGYDLGCVNFSGNYKTDKPMQTGTGWSIGRSTDIDEIFKSSPFHWAVGSSKWKYTTLEQFLKTYQVSSKFEELK
jgi:hypothetical protein